MSLEFASLVVPQAGADVVSVHGDERSVLAILADGAGGTSGGRETAQWVIEFVKQEMPTRADGLRQLVLEAALEAERRDAGQTTLIVASISARRIVGASVGDSEARLGERVLTEGQTRKPLIGAGMPRVHTFNVEFPLGALLIIGSDGLWKYASTPLVAPALNHPLEHTAREFIDAARLPNGALQDDTSVILVRNNPRPEANVEAELARGEATQALASWVASFNPSSDGALLESAERIGDTFVVSGWDCDVTTQGWQPWLLRWTASKWELRVGIVGFPGAGPSRTFEFDLESEWATLLRWP